MKKLGSVQERVVKNINASGGIWYWGIGWYWGSPSRTKSICETLVKKNVCGKICLPETELYFLKNPWYDVSKINLGWYSPDSVYMKLAEEARRKEGE